MSRLVDIVNFNADASCLFAHEWLAALRDGSASTMCRWLSLYVEFDRPVVLGFTGSAVADMAMLNPEALALINAHPGIFEVILRPFAHDIGPLRTAAGFELNVAVGREVIHREFANVVDFYLPPEFMLTSSQVKLLADAGVRGVFINPARFKGEVQLRLPQHPYLLEGALGSCLPCIPFRGSLTDDYLHALHSFDATIWSTAVSHHPGDRVFAWRDGESSFFVPDGLDRERTWLMQEARAISRDSLRKALAELAFLLPDQLPSNAIRYFPVHSFAAWVKEFRMLGYLSRVARLEELLPGYSGDFVTVWMQTINSDILSSVEKESPVVMLKEEAAPDGAILPFTIWRSERGFEGEDYVVILEQMIANSRACDALLDSELPHLQKLSARIRYMRRFCQAVPA